MVRRMLRWLARLALGAVALFGCLDPTQITVTVSTDVPCATVEKGRASVRVGSTSAESSSCSAGAGPNGSNRVGELVLVPSGSPDDGFVVTAVLGVTKPTADCDLAQPAGCIVARRSIRYIAHRPLRLPIALESSCLGVTCPANQTCSHGVCVDDTVDPNQCTNGDCPIPDAGAPDVSVADASGPDASCNADLLSDVKNCGKCGFDCSGGECVVGVCKLLPPNTSAAALATGACIITVLKDSVYFTTGATNGVGDVLQVPRTGGVETYAQSGIPGGTFGIATDGTEVFASSPPAVFPVILNNLSIMTSNAYGGAVASEGKTVCATTLLSPTGSGIECVPGGLVMKRSGATPVKLAVLGTSVLSTWSDGSLWKATIGAPPTGALAQLGSADGVAFINDTSSVVATPMTGEVVRLTEPASTASLMKIGLPRGVAYDPATQETYAANQGGAPNTGSIHVVSGTSAPRTLASNQGAPDCIALDSTAVYWLSGDVPMKAAR